MARDARQHPLEDLLRFSGIHRAARFVGEGDHPIDVGELALAIGVSQTIAHVMRHRRRAIHTGNDRQVVARAHAAVGPPIALEVTHLFRRIKRHRLRIGTERVVSAEILHRQVVRVHVLARRDASLGKADDLAVLSHRRSVVDFDQGNLMARADLLRGGDPGRAVEQNVARFDG